MSGEDITFSCNGDSYRGYISRPPTGSGPAVVVIQEYWGLVGHIKHVVDRFGAAGFNALAPDLYKGETASEPEEAGKLMMALNISETEKILRCAIQLILDDSATSSKMAGVVGFCMGGQLALYAAATNPSLIGACVDFYGIHPHVLPPLEQLSGPVLGFFADRDDYTPPEAVNKLDAQLTALGKEHSFKIYPNTDHAFFNDDRPEVYNPEAAADAWTKMIEFLRDRLS